MTVTFNAKPDPGSATAEISQGGVTTRELTYTARNSSAVRSDADITAAGPFSVGDYYSYGGTTDQTSLCTKIAAKQEADDPHTWRVTYSFDNDTSGRSGGEPGSIDPIIWTPDISWTTETVDKAIYKATPVADNPVSDAPIANSAGQPFEPTLTAPHSRVILSITRNELSLSPPFLLQFVNTTNLTAFYGIGQRLVLCRGISARKVWERTNSTLMGYWSVSYTFVFDLDGWDMSVLDQGSYSIVDGDRTYPRDEVTGAQSTEPVLLDGEGGILSVADREAGLHKFRTFRIYESSDFSSLNVDYSYLF